VTIAPDRTPSGAVPGARGRRVVYGRAHGAAISLQEPLLSRAARPTGVAGGGIAVVGVVAGIGLTMALLIAALAFPPGPLLEAARLAILVGSFVAAAAGLALGASRNAVARARGSAR